MCFFDYYTYLNGMTAGIFFIVCLVSGVWLFCSANNPRLSYNTPLFRTVGTMFLLMASSTVFYILSDIIRFDLYIVGTIIDYLTFTIISWVGYQLYANNRLSKLRLALLALPFIAIAVTHVFVPEARGYLFFVSSVLLFAIYVFFTVRFLAREKSLSQIYSDPESHSLKWIFVITLMMGLWMVFYHVFCLPALVRWYPVALYTYMACVVLFVFVNVLNYREPVSIETQMEIEQMEPVEEQEGSCQPSSLMENFVRLLTEERIYLDHDLTIESAAQKLGVSPTKMNAMLRYEMKTTLSQEINKYRVEHAKELLKDTDQKIQSIAHSCGFNSHQVFIRTFAKLTGKTPTEWRVG